MNFHKFQVLKLDKGEIKLSVQLRVDFADNFTSESHPSVNYTLYFYENGKNPNVFPSDKHKFGKYF